MAGTLTFGAFVAAITTIPSLRQRFEEVLGKVPVSMSMLRALAVVFAAANIKNLPFMWHVSLAASNDTRWYTKRS